MALASLVSDPEDMLMRSLPAGFGSSFGKSAHRCLSV
jgi:hypothetical protein